MSIIEVQAGRVPRFIGSQSHGSSMEAKYSQVWKFVRRSQYQSHEEDCFQGHIKRVIEVMETHLQAQRAIKDYRNESLRRDLYKEFTGYRGHRNKLSYGSGQENHLDGQELCEQGKKDSLFTVPHLLPTTLYSASQFPSLAAIFHADLGRQAA